MACGRLKAYLEHAKGTPKASHSWRAEGAEGPSYRTYDRYRHDPNKPEPMMGHYLANTVPTTTDHQTMHFAGIPSQGQTHSRSRTWSDNAMAVELQI